MARSSAEAEFRGMAHGVYELLWIRSILKDLGIEYATPMNLIVIIRLLSKLHKILYNMIVPNMLKLIVISSRKN